MKKIVLLILVVLTLGIKSFAGQEMEYVSLLQGDADGNIYIEENIHEMHPLASVTKVMTILLAYDAIEEGRIDLSDRVALGKEARRMKGSRIWIGSTISVEELIKATAVYSANNAAYGIAEYVGGSIDNFVWLMNEKVKELGLEEELEFHTPAGLPPSMTGRGMDVGTAKGIYKLSIEALKYPEYLEIASKKQMIIQGNQKIRNRNNLLSEAKGIYGLKTGYHGIAGYNIAVLSKRDGADLVTVLLGANSSNERKNIGTKAIDEFYSKYKKVKILDSKVPLKEIKIPKSDISSLELYPISDVERYVSIEDEVEVNVDIVEELVMPIKKGDILGSYTVEVNGKVVEEEEIKSPTEIEKVSAVEEVLREIMNK